MNETGIHLRAITHLGEEKKKMSRMTLLFPGSYMNFREIEEDMRETYLEYDLMRRLQIR